jgi:hypothetical protein
MHSDSLFFEEFLDGQAYLDTKTFYQFKTPKLTKIDPINLQIGVKDFPAVDIANNMPNEFCLKKTASGSVTLFGRENLPYPTKPSKPGSRNAINYFRTPYYMHTDGLFKNEPHYVTHLEMPYVPYRTHLDKKVLLGVGSRMFVLPLPVNFFQICHMFIAKNEVDPLVGFVMKWGGSTEYPISLYEIVRPHSPWPVPTITQIVDLVTKIALDINDMHSDLVFHATMNSIYITNPSKLGTTEPLKHIYCPFALNLKSELSNCTIPHHAYIWNHFANLVLCLAMWTTDLDANDPLRYSCATPGLLAIFQEVFKSANVGWKKYFIFDPNNNKITCLSLEGAEQNGLIRTNLTWMLKLADLIVCPSESSGVSHSIDIPNVQTLKSISPTLQFLYDMRNASVSQFGTADVYGLLQSAVCIDSPIINLNAVSKLCNLVMIHTDKDPLLEKSKMFLVDVIAQHISLIVPYNQKSETAVNEENLSRRMYIMYFVLYNLLCDQQFTKLQQVQTKISNANWFAFAVIMLQNQKSKQKHPILIGALHGLLCVRNDTAKYRFLHEDSARGLIKFMMPYANGIQQSMFHVKYNHLILICMVVSDFWKWCKSDDHAALNVWREMSDDFFLSVVLPCWNDKLSNETTKVLMEILGRIATYAAIKNQTQPSSVPRQKMDYIFGWIANISCKLGRLPDYKFADESIHLAKPAPQTNGAPENSDECYFDIQPYHPYMIYAHANLIINGQVANEYNYHYNRIRTIYAKDYVTLNPQDTFGQLFPMVTLVARNRPICSVLEQVTGTTGAVEFKINSIGSKSSTMFGVTWDANVIDSDTIPGFTAGSVGLTVEGILHYVDDDGYKQTMPFTSKIATQSFVIIGIAYDRIYFNVDGKFSRLIPNLTIPELSDVHAICRLVSPDTNLKIDVMTSEWTVNINAVANPLGYKLKTLIDANENHHLVTIPYKEHLPKLQEFQPDNLNEWLPILGRYAIDCIKMCHHASENCTGSVDCMFNKM